jgi:hypothetical protein
LDKNPLKISAQSELRISGNIRNAERPENRNVKQKRIEREIQSRRGSCPPGAMVAMDQRVTLLPSRGKAKQEEEEGGGLSPPLSRWRRNAPEGTIVMAIYTNNFAAFTTKFLPLYAVV